MKRVLTSAILTFTLFTQPTYAQFAGGMGGGFAMGGMPGAGAGYYPAMQGCPYNNGMYPGSFSGADDQSAADRIQAQIDKIQGQIDTLNDGGDYGGKYSISAMEGDLQAMLPSELYALAITDHMENLAECSCYQPPVQPAGSAPAGGGRRRDRPAADSATTSGAMNEYAPACLKFDVPDFVGQYPEAFKTVDNSWDVPPSTVKLPYVKVTTVASRKSFGGDRSPAADKPAKLVPKKKSSGTGGDPQAPAPAPVADQPSAPPAVPPVVVTPPVPAGPPQVCVPVPLPQPSSNACAGAGQWYPNGVCKPKGQLDGRLCTNEFLGTALGSGGGKQLTGEETSKCKRDLDELYRMLQKRKTLQAEIDRLEKQQFEAETGLTDGKKRGGRGGDMEARSGGGVNKTGLIIGGLLSLAGGAAGYFGTQAATNNACTMNAKLGYPCSGNNWGAAMNGIAGLGVGVPVIMGSLYSGASAGGAAGCGGSAMPYGMQPGYGMGGVPGMQGGAFGYPQGYGPMSPFGGGMMTPGYGAMMPGMGPFSQGMANPYGSPFGASPFGGMGGAYGGMPGMSPFGGYGGMPGAGFGSGAMSPYGLGGYAGYGGQNEMAYRLGYENPMGYASNMASAQAIVQNGMIGLNQINSGYGGYGAGAFGAGSFGGYNAMMPSYYGGGYPSSGFSLSAGFNIGSGGYYGANPYSIYGAGYQPSFASMSPGGISNVFGPTTVTGLPSTTGTTPFGR